MPIFRYKALDATGQPVEGELDAPDRKQAVRRLATRRLRPVQLKIDTSKAGKSAPAAAQVEHEDVNLFANSSSKPSRMGRFRLQSQSTLALAFLKKLLTLLQSGLPLGDALRLLSQRLTDPRMKDVAQNLWKRLSEGQTLAGAMRDMPEMFTESTAHLVEAGEASGSLVPILERIVDFMEETQELKKTVSSNLAYPVFVSTFAVGVVVFFLFFLLPKIRGMLDTLGGEMPLMAKLLIYGSNFLVQVGPFAIGAALIALISISQWRKTERGRRQTDLWLLKFPFVGQIYLYANIFQTTNLMATLLKSGVNTTETLRLVERTITNVILRAKFAVARRQIQEGVSMATAIQRVGYMPETAMDILTVGENTGSVVNSLQDINRLYREELSNGLRLLTTSISTLALLVAFALVAMIALTIVFSVFGISNSLTTR